MSIQSTVKKNNAIIHHAGLKKKIGFNIKIRCDIKINGVNKKKFYVYGNLDASQVIGYNNYLNTSLI